MNNWINCAIGAGGTVLLLFVWRYTTISRAGWWYFVWKSGCWCGIFRNREGVIPGRWGWYLFGLEFGSRNPGDRVGVFLKRVGLWPW